MEDESHDFQPDAFVDQLFDLVESLEEEGIVWDRTGTTTIFNRSMDSMGIILPLHFNNIQFESFLQKLKRYAAKEGKEIGSVAVAGIGNYAFRSFCNRCKQPRLLVDNKTPPNSKWLPRIGDWICTGCTNNNYASREKCKKCGQPKEIAAMPAFAIPGASLQTHQHYFPRTQGGLEQNLNLGYLGAFQQSQPLGSSWPTGGAGRYGVQPGPTWPFVGSHSSGALYANPATQVNASKGWRNGDWICTCGFHNYASRAECKKCNAAMPPALGTKRLASEDLVQDLDNKRLNAGHQAYAALGQLSSSVTSEAPLGQLASSVTNQTTLEHLASSIANEATFRQLADAAASQTTATYTSYPTGNSIAMPMSPLLPQLVAMPALPGKGAKQWRDGDWMCSNCNNHNYASRSQCNKCQTKKDEVTQPVSVA